MLIFCLGFLYQYPIIGTGLHSARLWYQSYVRAIGELRGFLLYVLRRFVSSPILNPFSDQCQSPGALGTFLLLYPQRFLTAALPCPSGLFLQRSPALPGAGWFQAMGSFICAITGQTEQPDEQLFSLSFLA